MPSTRGSMRSTRRGVRRTSTSPLSSSNRAAATPAPSPRSGTPHAHGAPPPPPPRARPPAPPTVASIRHAANDERRYSLRSLERYAPFIRRIHLVVDGAPPQWLHPPPPRHHPAGHPALLPHGPP